MTKTEQPQTSNEPTRNRGLAWAVVALVAVLAAAVGLYFAFVYEPEPEAESTPPTVAPEPTPSTVGSDAQAATDLATIEEAVAAFYGGDGQRAAELFELTDRTDQQIVDEAAYQAAIGGRLTLNCTGGTGGVFTCNVPYHNAITDALGSVDHGDTNQVVVEDGVITNFGFPEHTWINLQMGTFLAMEDRFDGYGECGFGPLRESCAVIQLENLDAWAEWRTTPFDKVGLVETTLRSWYGGNCEQALFLGLDDTPVSGCHLTSSDPSSPVEMIAYEDILGAEVSVEDCEELTSTALSCDVHYANKMNLAVGKTPTVTNLEFEVVIDAAVLGPGGDVLWYQTDYPEDAELRESFQQFAGESDLGAEYQEAGCATDRTAVCAQLIEDNLEAWAAWYDTNS